MVVINKYYLALSIILFIGGIILCSMQLGFTISFFGGLGIGLGIGFFLQIIEKSTFGMIE